MLALLLACATPTTAPETAPVAIQPAPQWEVVCEADGRATIEDPALGAASAEGPLYADQCGCQAAGSCYCTNQNLYIYAYDWGADVVCLVGWTVRISG
jgi:hypothetical protein